MINKDTILDANSPLFCIRCKGRGVHQDKLDPDGGIIECGLCSIPNGYPENGFEYQRNEILTRNDDNYLEMI